MMNFTYAPNHISIEDTTTTDTAYRVVATDGVAYTTTALMLAAGKFPFPYGSPSDSHPHLDTGMFPQSVLIRSIAADGVSDGSPFYADYNKGTQPTNGVASTFVSGSGQQLTFPGGSYYCFWVAKTAATDLIKITVFY